ncbi:hypothetical protein TWF281_009664 [Arthrobotrys megalospora]
MGRFIFWVFLFPLEVTGLFLVPYLLSNAPRANIVLTSGYMVVPSMGFHFLITTFRAFPFLRNKASVTFIKWFSIVNFGLQLAGSSALAHKIISHVEQGIHHENNIELFVLTLPFSIMQGILLFRPHLKLLGHTFYIKYLTLQMFPGTMIVFSRDKYWLWGPGGLSNLYARILIEFLPMIPFMMMVWPTLLAPKKMKEVTPPQEKINDVDVAITVKSASTAIRTGNVSTYGPVRSRF